MSFPRPHSFVIAALLLAAPVVSVPGQASDGAPRSGCFRFDFGRWEPSIEATKSELTRAGTSWTGADRGGASTMWEAESDSVTLLFPSWWPNGVAVRFDPEAAGDTLRGTAVALVPDGRVRPPRASVRAWRAECRGPAE